MAAPPSNCCSFPAANGRCCCAIAVDEYRNSPLRNSRSRRDELRRSGRVWQPAWPYADVDRLHQRRARAWGGRCGVNIRVIPQAAPEAGDPASDRKDEPSRQERGCGRAKARSPGMWRRYRTRLPRRGRTNIRTSTGRRPPARRPTTKARRSRCRATMASARSMRPLRKSSTGPGALPGERMQETIGRQIAGELVVIVKNPAQDLVAPRGIGCTVATVPSGEMDCARLAQPSRPIDHYRYFADFIGLLAVGARSRLAIEQVDEHRFPARADEFEHQSDLVGIAGLRRSNKPDDRPCRRSPVPITSSRWARRRRSLPPRGRPPL